MVCGKCVGENWDHVGLTSGKKVAGEWLERKEKKIRIPKKRNPDAAEEAGEKQAAPTRRSKRFLEKDDEENMNKRRKAVVAYIEARKRKEYWGKRDEYAKQARISIRQFSRDVGNLGGDNPIWPPRKFQKHKKASS
eukprot:g64810.t1